MSRIKGKNTKPEIRVRKLLHKLGYRFRLHRQDLPGCPDVVLPKYGAVIFVHGCYWHRHDGCSYAYMPKTRTQFWMEKLIENVKRDRRNVAELGRLGWRIGIIWECETKDIVLLRHRVTTIMNGFIGDTDIS